MVSQSPEPGYSHPQSVTFDNPCVWRITPLEHFRHNFLGLRLKLNFPSKVLKVFHPIFILMGYMYWYMCNENKMKSFLITCLCLYEQCCTMSVYGAPGSIIYITNEKSHNLLVWVHALLSSGFPSEHLLLLLEEEYAKRTFNFSTLLLRNRYM